MCAYKEIFCVYVIEIMLRLLRLHLKMWVQVAVLTELHQKTNSITRELVFWVKSSIFIASPKEIGFCKV